MRKYIIIMAMVGIIFILFIKKDKYIKIVYPKKISKYKLNFFIFDQFKVIFILLEPLYLYIVANNLYYVGIFNIVLGLSSLLCLYFIIRKVNISKYYKYINIIFTLVLFLKLNISNRYILLIIAILEGIGIKSSELVSVMNLYNYDEINGGYIIFSEWIFCLARVIILGIIYFLSIHLKVILYILLFGIFCLTFQYKKDT